MELLSYTTPFRKCGTWEYFLLQDHCVWQFGNRTSRTRLHLFFLHIWQAQLHLNLKQQAYFCYSFCSFSFQHILGKPPTPFHFTSDSKLRNRQNRTRYSLASPEQNIITAFPDVVMSEQYKEADLIACNYDTYIRDTYRYGVLNFVSIFSGLVFSDLGPVAADIACGTGTAFVVSLE